MTLNNTNNDSGSGMKPLYILIAASVVVALIIIIILGILSMQDSDKPPSGGEVIIIPDETKKDTSVNKTESADIMENETGDDTVPQEIEDTENETELDEDEKTYENVSEEYGDEIQDSKLSPSDAKIQELINKLHKYDESVFDVYEFTQNESEVHDLIDIVNRECRDKKTFKLQTSCAVLTVLTNSKKSEICNYPCLPSFCEMYKMHVSAYIVNQMLPDKQIFMAVNRDGYLFILYKEEGEWRYYNWESEKINLSRTTAIYNDEYSLDNNFDVVAPKYVKRDGKFCFEIYVDEPCICKIKQHDMQVGTCPQLTTEEFLSLCEVPIEEFDFFKGRNEFCFEIPKANYTKGLYTYSFEFVSDTEYFGMGNSIIEVSKHNCAIEGKKLQGFVIVK